MTFWWLVWLVVLAVQVPWPGPGVFRVPCARDGARLVRRVVAARWGPALTRRGVTLPLECPLHQARDLFAPREAAKRRHRASQWTCALCGKAFYEERHLDAHFDARHAKGTVNMAEDAVCFADYCDIMRCEVLMSQDAAAAGLEDPAGTDVEVWREATAYRTALAVSPGGRDLARVSKGIIPEPPAGVSQTQHRCGTREQDTKTKSSESGDDADINATQNTSSESSNGEGEDCSGAGDLVDSPLPPVDRKQQRLSELKAHCKPEELLKLKTRCEVLVRTCIAGLLAQLSDEDFRQLEDELNRAVCWFLTCDRYWQDTTAGSASDARAFPWGLLALTAMVLSLGLCLCYYVVWVLFDGDDGTTSVTSTSGSGTAPPTPARPLSGAGGVFNDNVPGAPPDGADYNDHYIYVTYPPDLKRRLLESCYNRTTRL